MSQILVKIPNVTGDATATDFAGQIQCTGLRHAVDVTVSAKTSQRTEGASNNGPVELSHKVDQASPALREKVAGNSELGTVVISRLDSGATVETLTLYSAKLVRLDVETLYDPVNGQPADQLLETFALSYDAIQWSYTDGSITGSWNSSTASKDLPAL